MNKPRETQARTNPNLRKTDGYQQQPELESERYHCSSEWHLSRLAPLCGVIHSRLLQLTDNGERTFFGSQEGLAEYFGCKPKTIYRAFKQLVTAGFFEVMRKGTPGETNSYSVLNHATWAEKHPGQCVTRIVMPWADEEIRLGKQLWAYSGGIEWPLHQVKNIIKFGLSEEEVIERFEAYWSEEGQYIAPKSAPLQFYFKLNAEVRAKQRAEAAVDSVSETIQSTALSQ